MAGLGRTFDAVVVDWDGLDMANTGAPVRAVRRRLEQLSRHCVDVAVVSAGPIDDVDGRLRARPSGPGRLFLALNGGIHLYVVDEHGPRLCSQRTATASEAAALDHAAASAIQRLASRGLAASLGSTRPTVRRIDLTRGPDRMDPPLRDIGSPRVVPTGRQASLAAEPGVTSDGTSVEIGLTDQADAVGAVLRRFDEHGIGPGLTLFIGGELGAPGARAGGDPLVLPRQAARMTVVSVGAAPVCPAEVLHRPGGQRAFLRLLDEQLRRRQTRRVPSVDDDQAWTLTVTDGGPLQAQARESLLTLGDGRVAIRGSHEETSPDELPLLLADGVYGGDGPAQHLIVGPSPLSLTVRPNDAVERRVLDLRSGVLMREERGPRAVSTFRFVAAERHGVIVMRAEGPVSRLAPGPLLRQLTDRPMTTGRTGSAVWALVANDDHGGIAVAATESASGTAGRRTVERIAAYVPDPRRPASPRRALAALGNARRRGFERLLSEHRAAWARRWNDACVSIPNDPKAQLAARFALFQLWNNVAGRGEAGVGARGLSGPGYAGHVFWDADVFVLPAIATMAPTAARAMLEYRIRRLPRARERARARGLDGARFPWESASSGDDVTPTFGWVNGAKVPIRTGELEEHIGADVAWAACHYADWTDDPRFLTGPGRPLITETARYWASRCRTEADGRAHIRHVIGPDEYHEDVDDNAYTNMLARWNLRRAATLEGPSAETDGWLQLADALVDGYDPATGRHEQFAGYYQLEPLLVADVGTPPLAADVLLGAARVAGAQIIKQPDVLMAHHLLPQEMPPGSLSADVAFYLARTAHGSSLSPAVTASVLARAGMPDEALQHLDIALRLDLDDLTGTTGAGLHMATLAGVWQALLFGFAGLHLVDGAVVIDPCLPQRWPSLQLRFRCRRRRLDLRITRETAHVAVSGPLRIAAAGGDAVRVTKGVCFDKTDGGWVLRHR